MTQSFSQNLQAGRRIAAACLWVMCLSACSEPPQPALQPAQESQTPWAIGEITADDIGFMKSKYPFEFDTLEYGSYAQIEPEDEARFQEKCEGLSLKSGQLKQLIVNAQPLSPSDGRHGFDRGIDHCALHATVFIKSEVYDLSLTAFGVGVLWHAEPGKGPERYFLTKNCGHAQSYIQWYFEETGHHPGLDDFQSSAQVKDYFCRKAAPK